MVKSSASWGRRLPNLRQLQEKCVRDYRKYSDTVAVSCAIYHLFRKNPEIASFVGIEHKLKNDEGKSIRPDLVATYDSDQKGLIFELKWSLPFDDDLLEKEVKELRKYVIPCSNWRTTSDHVQFHDLILICHIDDAKRVVDMVKKVSKDVEYNFLGKKGFAIWSWTITPPKIGERKEELRLFPVYGRTRNQKIEALINQSGGKLFPEDVLTYLRFSFTFVRQKPPIQYVMTVLIQNIFPSFQQKPDRDFYEIKIDTIYERAKAFFPSWHEFDRETIQIKRRWIREALENLWELKLCEKVLGKPDWWNIPIPTLKSRKPIQSVLCKKTAKEYLKRQRSRRSRGRPRERSARPRGPRKEPPLNHFFGST